MKNKIGMLTPFISWNIVYYVNLEVDVLAKYVEQSLKGKNIEI